MGAFGEGFADNAMSGAATLAFPHPFAFVLPSPGDLRSRVTEASLIADLVQLVSVLETRAITVQGTGHLELLQ